MSDARIQYLISRLLEGTCSPVEKEELASWVNQVEGDDALKNMLEQAWEKYEPESALKEEADPALNRIMGNLFTRQEPATRRPRFLFRYAAAAAIILAAGSGIFFWAASNKEKLTTEVAVVQDIWPGGNKATLTLSNGQQIYLDSASNGILAQQGNAMISKQAGGQIVYNNTGESSGEILNNTMTTPRGGEYQLSLPDGTKAWLNAASSITFPAAFNGKDRSVKITGEVYLEVAKDKSKPFFVTVNDVKLEVLGTHFNVNAYDDEETVKTTLLEGSVKVNVKGSSLVIAPGEQARVSAGGRLAVMAGVDLAETMAWKRGRFVFEGAPIATVLRQLARWYDVEVVGGEDVDDLFFADVSRNKKISDVLKALELTGRVKFSIEGRKIMIMK